MLCEDKDDLQVGRKGSCEVVCSNLVKSCEILANRYRFPSANEPRIALQLSGI